MDISFTDHSYIIGRGGNNIKKIMEDTLTHIHFPDSNRSSQTEKSNQVSLCGSLKGVEKARSLVRVSNNFFYVLYIFEHCFQKNTILVFNAADHIIRTTNEHPRSTNA